jgi:hypothetical protein
VSAGDKGTLALLDVDRRNIIYTVMYSSSEKNNILDENRMLRD